MKINICLIFFFAKITRQYIFLYLKDVCPCTLIICLSGGPCGLHLEHNKAVNVVQVFAAV